MTVPFHFVTILLKNITVTINDLQYLLSESLSQMPRLSSTAADHTAPNRVKRVAIRPGNDLQLPPDRLRS